MAQLNIILCYLYLHLLHLIQLIQLLVYICHFVDSVICKCPKASFMCP